MKPFFRKKEKITVGLDLGASAVKAVKLKFAKDGSVECCGFNLEPVQLDMAPVLSRIVQAEDADRVNVSLCGPSVVIRYINFPKMQAEELRQALRFEAQKHIPFSVNEVNLDAHILKQDLPDNKMLVLVAAVKKDFISQQLKVLNAAGIRPNLIDIDSLALINAFNFNYPDVEKSELKAVALLNIGTKETNLNILDKGIPRLSRDIYIGGNNFTQKLMEVFGVDFKAAEELKINPDKDKAEKVLLVAESVFSNLSAEIRVSFDYYESQGASSVNKIFLCGGSSLLPGLKDMLANTLDIEVGYWDPFVKINIPANIDSQKLKGLSARMAVAAGLALR